MSAMNPPDSPPKAPVIPEGLATKLGKYGAPLILVLGLLADFADVDLDTETLAAFIGSVVVLVTTIAGRMAQAAAIYRDAPSPLQGVTNVANQVNDWIDGPDGGVTVLAEGDNALSEPDFPEPGEPTVPPGLSQG